MKSSFAKQVLKSLPNPTRLSLINRNGQLSNVFANGAKVGVVFGTFIGGAIGTEKGNELANQSGGNFLEQVTIASLVTAAGSLTGSAIGAAAGATLPVLYKTSPVTIPFLFLGLHFLKQEQNKDQSEGKHLQALKNQQAEEKIPVR